MNVFRNPFLPALFATLASLAVAPIAPAENVTGFLGSRTAPSDGPTPPEHWSETENVGWKTEIPGLAWSSPVVWKNKVFLTTCIALGETKPPVKGLYFADLDANKYDLPKVEHEWKLYCLELGSGKILWERTVHKGLPDKTYHLKNTLASETPLVDGQRVYAYFGNLGLFTYDLDGKLLWKTSFPAVETRYGWGTGASPTMHGDMLFVVNDNEDESYLVALDKATGRERWRVTRDEKSNFVTPLVWAHEGRTELVTAGSGGIKSYDLEGNPLWVLKGMSYLAIPTPQVAGELLYVTSGHVMDKTKPLYAIRPGAKGDISLSASEDSNDFVAWCQKKAGSYHPTPVIADGQVYLLYDQGFFAAYDAASGKQVYGKQRIPGGRAFTASPWAYGGKVFCLNEDGVTFIIDGGKEFKIVGENRLAEDDMCMATPVIAGRQLLIRASKRIYSIEQSPSAQTRR